eukprot:scaffold20191_cov79-Skeletonema_dohrnii-CCMP3373.AAC.2
MGAGINRAVTGVAERDHLFVYIHDRRGNTVSPFYDDDNLNPRVGRRWKGGRKAQHNKSGTTSSEKHPERTKKMKWRRRTSHFLLRQEGTSRYDFTVLRPRVIIFFRLIQGLFE